MVSEVWKRSACSFIEMSVEEREQFLLREGGDVWITSLSQQERDAIARYILVSYIEINRAMRSGEYIGIYGVRVERDLTDRRIALIQQALMRSSSPRHLIVRRGIDDAFLHTYIDAQGTTIVERAFTSTTILDDVGFGYLKATIYVPKGSPGAYVEPLIRRAGKKEWEFLLPSGSSFKIIRTYHNEDVGKCVEMEYLGVV